MARKQKLIHLNGEEKLTRALAENAQMAQGEIAVFVAPEAKDVELYALGKDGEVATFPTLVTVSTAIEDAVKDIVGEGEGTTIVALKTAVEAAQAAADAAQSDATQALTDAAAADGKAVAAQGAADAAAAAADAADKKADDNLAAAQGYTDEKVGEEAEAREELAGRVGAIEADYLTSAAKTELEGKITAEETRAKAEEGKLNTAIEAEATRAAGAEESLQDAIDAIEADYLKAADKTELDGKITAEASRADTAEKAIAADVQAIKEDYLTSTDKTELDGKITTNTNAIATLNGADTVEGSVKKQIKDAVAVETGRADAAEKAIADRVTVVEGKITTLNGDASTEGSVKNEVSKAIAEVVANAPEELDTLKEIADFITNDTTGAAALSNAIAANKKAIEDEVTRAESAEAELSAKIGAQASGDTPASGVYADFAAADAQVRIDFAAADAQIRTDFAAADTTLGNRIKAIEDDYLKAADKTELDGKITAAEGRANAYADQAEVDAKAYTDERETAITTAYGVAIKAATDALDSEVETTTDNGLKVKVVQADGKLTEIIVDDSNMVIDCGTY